MTEKIDVFQQVMGVAPPEGEEGSTMTLMWDGAGEAIIVGEFDGQEVTTEVSPSRLYADILDLQEQVDVGGLRLAFRDDELVKRLEELYG